MASVAALSASSCVIVSEEGEDLAAKASSCLRRGLGFVMRASLEGALGLKSILGKMRPRSRTSTPTSPAWERAVSVEVETRDGRLERASPGDGGSRLWRPLYQSGALGSYDKLGLLSRLSRARGIFNEGGDPGRAGMELLKRFCEIEDGQATIDNRLAGGAVEDSGVLALLSSGIDDPSEAYLAFRQLADLEASLGAFSPRLTCDPFGLPPSRGLCGRILAQEAASMLRLAANSRIGASCGDDPYSSVRLTLNCQSCGRGLAFLNNVMASGCDGGLIFQDSSKRGQMPFKALGVRAPRGAVTFPF